METVTYSIEVPYQQVANVPQPAVEVELKLGNHSVKTVAIVDSGSTHSVFSVQFAKLLHIDDVTKGRLERASTMGAGVEFYMFDLEMRFPKNAAPFQAQVGFFPVSKPRNILGRIVFFSRFQVGFHEVKQKSYFLETE